MQRTTNRPDQDKSVGAAQRRWLTLAVNGSTVALSVRLRGAHLDVRFGRSFDLSKVVPSLQTAVGTNTSLLVGGQFSALRAHLAIIAVIGGLVIGATSRRPATVATWVSTIGSTAVALRTGHHGTVLLPFCLLGCIRELLERRHNGRG